MKVGIIGCGFVGATAAYAIVLKGFASEVVLIDVDETRASAEAADILHAVPFGPPVDVIAGGYEDLAGSKVVIITAGVAQKPGESRLKLLDRNAAILEQIVPRVLEHAPQAMLLVATNPVDVMTHLVARFAASFEVGPERVIGSGTTLDTARFRALLGQALEVDPQHVHGYVIGEHGDSEVLSWSIVDIGGITLDEFVRLRNLPFDDSHRRAIDQNVRSAAYQIIAGKRATYYGIGAALARIVNVLVHDHRAILTVCSPTDEIAGLDRVTVSLPRLVSGDGVLATLPLRLSEEETKALAHSAEIICDQIIAFDARK